MNFELKYYKDIKCNEYLFNLKPWKNGKLATIDGWGKFATFEITEKDKIKIKQITDFPKKQITDFMKSFPEVEIMYAASMFQLHYFADLETKVCKEIWPFTIQGAEILNVYLLDKKKIFLLTYGDIGESDSFEYLIYDFPNGKFLNNPYKEKNIFKKDIFKFQLSDGKFICYKRKENDEDKIEKNNVYLYDILKNEKSKNKLTDFLSLNPFEIIRHNKERKLLICLEKNYEYILLTYDENYDNIKIEPLVMQDDKIYSVFVSDDFKWAFVTLGGYKGLNGELLEKYGFIDLSKPVRYIVKTEDFYKTSPFKYGFIEHPIHKTIFLFETEVNERKILRLYKMSDVEKITQEYLLEKAKGIVQK